jgi:melibiose permease/lactose/raffinose/galactose permease
MVYALVSMYLVYYLTEALDLPDATLAWVATLVLAARLFDAVMDIVMGSIVDNTRSRWGHFKPWILAGMIASGLFTVLLFSDLGLTGTGFIVLFSVLYLFWGLSWTANDIPYWSMLPALTLDQRQRERIGALAKVFATIGLFTVVVAIIPVTTALTPVYGAAGAWTVFAGAVVAVMIAGQCVTLVGTKEPSLVIEQDKVTLKDIARTVFRNDQLMWTAIAMILFMTGYVTTTTFGTYYFKYIFGDEGMYAPFGAVLGVAQIAGFLVFPLLRRRFSRRALYSAATALVGVGYIGFFFAPVNIWAVGAAALLLFSGTSFIILLMLVFVTDTVDYGHWKLGQRRTAITFALQPFINKVGAALATQIAAVTLIFTGINSADSPADVTSGGRLGLKLVMLVLPLVLIAAGYIIYRAKYRIDERFHAQILADLTARGQLTGPEDDPGIEGGRP